MRITQNVFALNAASRASGADPALRAFARGEMVVVSDDHDREDEADLIVAASLCTPAQVAFMIRHTSGILCCPLTRDAADRLALPPMVARNDAPLGTAFTVSVDVRHGLTTGISAAERCATARALAEPDARAEDFVRPGHMFPLVAHPDGVLGRPGHTEAAVDLCRLSGVAPVGLIGELMNDDGTVTRGEAVRRFALAHGLVRLSVADLIAYRRLTEGLSRVA